MASSPARAAAPLAFRIDVAATRSHTYRITLSIPAPAAETVVSLPVWIPGSYMVREFGRHLSRLQARQGRAERAVEPLDKTTWRIRCSGTSALVLSYEVYAFDTSVRTAYLSPDRGFFNGTSLCLRVHGREAGPQRLALTGLPRGWRVATAMPPAPGGGPLEFVAADYDELVDHPFELGPFWEGRFSAGGVEHVFVVAGAWPTLDGQRLLADSRRICQTVIALWHGQAKGGSGKPPFGRYVFMLNAVDEGYGGLEHRASTALIANRRDLPRAGQPDTPDDGYLTLLGLISHEYFHSWNVKRLRPAALCPVDYTRENYTELLWFFEGFTSYYDDLALVRAGLIDEARYLALLAKTDSGVQGMPGRGVQSVAQASFDAWNKYYRPDENTANATVSYYTKGSQVALCLDLTLRAEGRGSLDDVMRQLWARGRRGGRAVRDPGDIPITEAHIAEALAAVGGRSYERELAKWVHGTGELPLDPLLALVGVQRRLEDTKLAGRLGLRLNEGPVTGCVVRAVLRGSAAEAAGLQAGDELIAVDGWRLRRLDDAASWLTPGGAFDLTFVRDQRLAHTRVNGSEAGSVSLPQARWSVDAGADDSIRRRRAAWLRSTGR